MATTVRHGLPLLLEGQGKAEITVNDALVIMDACIDKATENAAAGDNDPPNSPANGKMWFVSATPTAGSAWAGHASQLALYYNGWIFITPSEGMVVYEKTTDILKDYNGTSWNSV